MLVLCVADRNSGILWGIEYQYVVLVEYHTLVLCKTIF